MPEPRSRSEPTAGPYGWVPDAAAPLLLISLLQTELFLSSFGGDEAVLRRDDGSDAEGEDVNLGLPAERPWSLLR